MFEDYKHRRQLKRLVNHEDLNKVAASWRTDIGADVLLTNDKAGVPKAYLTDTLRPVDPLSLELPFVAHCCWYVRNRDEYNDLHCKAKDLIAFMRMRKAEVNHGVAFIRAGGNELYLTQNSLDDGEWMHLYTKEGERLEFPTVMLREIRWNNRIEVTQYTMQLFDLVLKEPVTTWKPVVELIPCQSDKLGAYTRLKEAEGCPGVHTHESFDVQFNIDLLDNSANPIVDLGVFIRAFREGFDHQSEKWSLNVDNIQVKYGMRPKPQHLKWLKTDNPENRFFLNDTGSAGFWGNADYTYTAKLPTGFP
jgi:hypothetical protein